MGTAVHGTVLYNAIGAALRGLKMIVPISVISAELIYPEQYTAWHLKNALRVSAQITFTLTDLLAH